MKQHYVNAEMDVLEFSVRDIIRASSGDDSGWYPTSTEGSNDNYDPSLWESHTTPTTAAPTIDAPMPPTRTPGLNNTPPPVQHRRRFFVGNDLPAVPCVA